MSGIREPCPAFMAHQELGNQPALSLIPAAEGRQARVLTELSIPRKDTNTKQIQKTLWLVTRAKAKSRRATRTE